MIRRIMKCGAVLAALGCIATVGAGRAYALCGTGGCNPATHHWSAFDHGVPSGKVGIGMAKMLNGKYVPMMCSWDGSQWQTLNYQGSAPAPYTMPQLTADTSICLGEANTELVRFDTLTKCYVYGGGYNNVYPFSNGGFDFNVSAEEGNDIVDYSWVVSEGEICGGPGVDFLYGGTDFQYITGGAQDDYVCGSRNTDNVRGNSGNDIVLHRADEGTDWLRGEDGNDCMRVAAAASYDPRSSCGDGTEQDFYIDYGGTPLLNCETKTSGCCNLSDGC
jgi:hypothetical protein